MKRIPLTLVWILVATVLCSAQTTVYLPQIVDGGAGFGNGITWSTAIGVTNPAAAGSAAASGTLTFTQSNGTPFNIPFNTLQGNPIGSGNTVSFSLSGGQTSLFSSTGTEPLTVGYAAVTSNLPITIAAVFLETVQPVSGPAISYSAGVAAVSPVTSQAIFVIQQESTSTAVALANPSNSAANVSFQLVTTAGVASSSASITVAANSQTAQYVNQLFPNISSPFLGTMQITSKTPLVATSLLFSGANSFGTLPVISVGSLMNPAFEWLERRPWLTPLTSIARLLSGLQFRLG